MWIYICKYESMNLKGKVVVVTGSSDGIWREIALRLAKDKVKLVLIARNKEKLNAVADKTLNLWAVSAHTYVCDISDTVLLESTVTSIISDLWEVDILINNAGIWQKLMPVDEMEWDRVEKLIQTNLTGLIHSTRLFLPTLRRRDEAAIINISSKSGVTAQMWQSVYTATKYGVRWFTEVLKEDLKETNIRVAGIYQSGTNTGMFASADQDFPIEKFTDPADLADVVGYMLWLPPKIWLHDVRVAY